MEKGEDRGYCNSCGQTVPASRQVRDGKVYLVKDCAQCGFTETLLSSDVRRYRRKQEFEHGPPRSASPRVILVEVTNSCNINCPTCLARAGKCEAKLDPPLEYFERLFREIKRWRPPPHVELFGGEPTMRDDLPSIVEIAAKSGLKVSVCTNGIRLAEEDYCRRLLSTGAGIHFQFDGTDSRAYQLLRGNEHLLEKKLAALEQIRKYAQNPIVLFCTLAKGINHDQVGDIITFCHERRDFIGGLYLIPLAHTWENGDVQFTWDEKDRLTVEDIESLVSEKIAQLEFLPAGSVEMPAPFRRILKPIPAFLGASPNCESITYLLSKEEQFVSFSHYLKTSLFAFAEDLKREARRNDSARGETAEAAAANGRKVLDPILANIRYARLFFKHVNMDELVRAKGVKRYAGLLRLLFAVRAKEKRRKLLEELTGLGPAFRLVILPYRDRFQHESRCVERCPVAVACMDPESNSVVTVSLCSWSRYRLDTLSRIAHPVAPPCSR
jgi:uncharacterized radical SAM superfamily Fe-S cluster-containing enzyme